VCAVNVNRGVPYSEGFKDVAHPKTAFIPVASAETCVLVAYVGIMGVKFLRAEIQKEISGLGQRASAISGGWPSVPGEAVVPWPRISSLVGRRAARTNAPS
jgi:hypothetical protein